MRKRKKEGLRSDWRSAKGRKRKERTYWRGNYRTEG